MIPSLNEDLNIPISVVKYGTIQPEMHIEEKRIFGNIDGVDALKQAIHKMLNTERYQYLIYSWNYGIETYDLYGKSMDYAMTKLRFRIPDALMQDDRVLGVDNFKFSTPKRNCLGVECTVHTIYGDITEEMAVNI